MKINSVYIGGWFQRTMLQLSEIYDFLRDGKSKLKLDQEKLDEHRKNLQLGNIEYGVSGEEYIYFTTGIGVNVKIFEDGLIILNNKNVSEDTLISDIDKVQDYYENKLSKALNYLFSLGAPVPKELANIENVYPYFIVSEKATEEQMRELLLKTDKQKYFEFKNDKYNVIRGDKYYFINNKLQSMDKIERYIEEQVFIRKFKGQLYRYLNIHRIKSGSILIDDENIYNYTKKVYSSNVSGIFQKPFIFDMSIKDNLSLVDNNPKRQIEACKRVGIHDFILSLPKGYNTVISDNDGLISDGQKQLIVIARTLLSKAEILLLDEVTSNIDPTSTTQIRDVLQDLKQDHTIIMITHKPEMMEVADRVIVLDKGKVVSKGTNEEVFEKSELYRELRNRTFASISISDM